MDKRKQAEIIEAFVIGFILIVALFLTCCIIPTAI